MASGSALLPPPSSLEIHDPNAADKWKKFLLAWKNYALATELTKKSEGVQVATLLTVIGEEAREVYSTFNDWNEEGDEQKIVPVLTKFGEYCQPRKNVPFERYKFNRRKQEPGETYDQYRTALRKIAECCDFNTITPEEILRDRLLFGIRDNKVRERLLRETKLTLKKTDEICRASESMLAQMKVVEDNAGALINVINQDEREQKFATERGKFKGKHAQPKECGNCGRSHDVSKRESCPAYGKTCRKCGKPNHFAAKCRSRTDNNPRKDVRTVDDECEYDEGEEVFNTYDISTINLDDSQLVTLKLESGNYLRFQPDTGAQCNVIPIDIYKKATKDYRLERVKPANTQLAAYGGSKLTVAGLVRIRVWCGNYKCQLDC